MVPVQAETGGPDRVERDEQHIGRVRARGRRQGRGGVRSMVRVGSEGAEHDDCRSQPRQRVGHPVSYRLSVPPAEPSELVREAGGKQHDRSLCQERCRRRPSALPFDRRALPAGRARDGVSRWFMTRIA
jgi:hypothetical protein